jgi:capsular polysaccharide biosynthesis protein
VNPASLPDSPSSPNRLLFAGGGLGAGLALGFGLALWLELRDKSIRTEEDVVAALEMPMLVSVPWVSTETNGNGSWRSRFRPSAEEDPEKIEV